MESELDACWNAFGSPLPPKKKITTENTESFTEGEGPRAKISLKED